MQAKAVELKGEKVQSSTLEPKLITTRGSLILEVNKTTNAHSQL